MIEVYPLGAGQDVGRSCIIISIEDKTIMLDCGVHMGFQDMRKYPDFQKIGKKIDLVLISHFHLDHCGALPYYTEIFGYDGPVVMTFPTKAIFPYMLEDFRKLALDSQGFPNEPIFSLEQLKKCLLKISTIGLHETQNIGDITIKCYYAGHVLGACMFYIEYRGKSVVYTGDFNSSADRQEFYEDIWELLGWKNVILTFLQVRALMQPLIEIQKDKEKWIFYMKYKIPQITGEKS